MVECHFSGLKLGRDGSPSRPAHPSSRHIIEFNGRAAVFRRLKMDATYDTLYSHLAR
jgi:hypothetical protein